jgi:hypothetical protein
MRLPAKWRMDSVYKAIGSVELPSECCVQGLRDLTAEIGYLERELRLIAEGGKDDREGEGK